MMRVCNAVKHKVCQEQSMITVIQNRYLASVEVSVCLTYLCLSDLY